MTFVVSRILSTLGTDGVERILQRELHEGAALHVDHANRTLGGVEHDGTSARRAGRIIDRTEQARFGWQVGMNFALVPDVVTARDHSGARAEQVDADLWGYAAAVGRVFAVDDDEIDPMLVADVRQ